MITSQDLKGCYPALITPMKDHHGEIKIDFYHFYKLIEDAIDSGCAGILIAGTTGQSATISLDEHVELVARGAEYARGHAEKIGRKVLVIGSSGSNSTEEALYLSREISRETHIDAFLHVTGYYNNPPQEGLLKHYRKVADFAAERDSGVILYNVPSRTNSNIEPSTCIELARHPAILAVKEASGNLTQVDEIIAGTREEDFTVLSGEDHLVADIIKRGGTGVISASANMWPREFQTLTDLANAGEHEKAAELQEALLPCVNAVFSIKNPIPLHHMLKTSLRSPLVDLHEVNEDQKAIALEKIKKATSINVFPHVKELVKANV